MRAGSNQTVVVLFPGALGDLMLVLPTLRRLRAIHAEAHLAVAVDRRFAALVVAARVADHVAAVDDPEIARTLGGGAAPDWWGHAAYLYSWLGGRDADGRHALARHADTAAFLRVVRGDGAVHAAFEYASGIGWQASWESLVDGATIEVQTRDRITGPHLGAGALVVHRGAGTSAKRWDPNGFAGVVARWRARIGPVLDLRGPADGDLPPLPGAMVIEPTVSELAGVLAAATAFLGNDSGPAHVAGAVGASGVVLFGPTRATRWRPPSTRIVALQAAPSPGAGFGRLDPSVVADAIEALAVRT